MESIYLPGCFDRLVSIIYSSSSISRIGGNLKRRENGH